MRGKGKRKRETKSKEIKRAGVRIKNI